MKKLDVGYGSFLFLSNRAHQLTQSQDIIPGSTPFLKSFKDLLKKIFVYDPAQRISAKAALSHPWFKETAHPDDGTEAAKIKMERMKAQSLQSGRG